MVSSDASEEGQESSPFIKKESLLYGIIFLNTLITVMNTSMFNVALPDISDHFRIDAKAASLIVSSYSIVFALSAILYSKFSSVFPIKFLLLGGILLLEGGSIIGMIASSYPLLIVARIVQALGASSISALSIIITTKYVPSRRRGKRLGVVASAVTLGFGLGPLTGGVLTQYLGWEYLFGISLVALVGVPFYLLLLPYEKGKKEKFDYTGMILFFTAVVLLLGGIASSWVYAPLALFVFIIYLLHIHRHPSPFMQPSLLRDKKFLTVIGVGFIIYFVNFSLFFSLPLILSRFYGMENTALIGLTLFPGAIAASVSSVFIGRAVDRYGPEEVMFCGTVFMPLAILLASVFGKASILFILLIFAVSSCSFVCITTSLPNILTKNLSVTYVSTGIGTLQLFQYIGGGIGVTVSGKLLTLFQEVYPDRNEYVLVLTTLFVISLVAILLFHEFAKGENVLRRMKYRIVIYFRRSYRLARNRMIDRRRG